METMITKIEQLEEISSFLKEKDYMFQLNNLKATLENSEYLLSVMGQFSAGKSCLINNLIGKEVLPVHITETTAVITMLKYGEEERAEILYNDNTVEETNIEDTLSLWQSGESQRINKINTIILYVDSPLLKNGLTIADTPGINTIISRHVSLTTEILNASHRIMYVLGKPLSQSDVDFVKGISDCGLPLMFVRTHMDDMRAGEENIYESIESERKTLSKFTNDDVFFLSNENNNEFYQYVKELHAFLMNHLAADTKKALMESVEMQVALIAAQLNQHLSERKEQLSLVVNGDRSDYTKKKQEIESVLKKMEIILDDNRRKVSDNVQQLKKDAKDNLDAVKAAECKKLERRISAVQAGDNIEVYAAEAERAVKDSFNEMYYAYVDTFDRFISANSEELETDFSRTSTLFEIDPLIPDNLDETTEQLAEIEGKMEALLLAKQQLAEEIEHLEAQKENALINRETTEVSMIELQNCLAAVQQELNEYPEYERQYVIVQEADHRVENTMRRIGCVADWATLLIPSPVMVAGAAKVLKAGANVIPKAGKLANVAAKMAKAGKQLANAKKAQKAIHAVDVIHDVAKGIKESAEMLNDSDERKTSILDFLSIEYYMGKIGKKFDKPEIREIDHEYEKQYYDEKRRIQEQVRQSSEAELKKRMELLDITSEIEKAELAAKINRSKQQTADAELQQLSARLEQEKNVRKVNQIHTQYVQEACKKLEELYDYILNTISVTIDQKLEDYLMTCDFSVKKKIQHKRAEMEALDIEFNSADKASARKSLDLCGEYETMLSTILNS